MTSAVSRETLVNEGATRTGSAKFEDFANTVNVVVGREWRRLMSEPSRVIGILLQPLLFLLVFGAGLHESFYVTGSDITYIGFLFPGMLALVVLFATIYSTLTLVEDKKCGFFRSVLFGPGGIQAAIIGKIMATASVGLVQGLLFSSLIMFLPVNITLNGIGYLVMSMLVGSVCCSIIGVSFAWILETSAAFHAFMSVVLIPMWLLSGAMFPISRGIFYWLSFLNPMAYLVAGLRASFTPSVSVVLSQMLAIIAFSLVNLLWLMRRLYARPLE